MVRRAWEKWDGIIQGIHKGRRLRTPRSNTWHRTLRFEQFEDRRMLAMFTVNSMEDGTDGGNTTLREAVQAAFQSQDPEDMIKFDPTVFANGGIIELTQGQLTINETTKLIIDGTRGIAGGVSVHAPGSSDGVIRRAA
jgi:CSLREA domain-containing protein